MSAHHDRRIYRRCRTGKRLANSPRTRTHRTDTASGPCRCGGSRDCGLRSRFDGLCHTTSECTCNNNNYYYYYAVHQQATALRHINIDSSEPCRWRHAVTGTHEPQGSQSYLPPPLRGRVQGMQSSHTQLHRQSSASGTPVTCEVAAYEQQTGLTDAEGHGDAALVSQLVCQTSGDHVGLHVCMVRDTGSSDHTSVIP